MQCRFCDAQYRVKNEWVLIWSAHNLLGCWVLEYPMHLAWFSYSKCSFHLAAGGAGAPLNWYKTTHRQGTDCYCHLWKAEFKWFAHCHTLSCGSGRDITLLSKIPLAVNTLSFYYLLSPRPLTHSSRQPFFFQYRDVAQAHFQSISIAGWNF